MLKFTDPLLAMWQAPALQEVLMKKKRLKKLTIHRETLCALSDLHLAVGAVDTLRTVCATGCATNCPLTVCGTSGLNC